MGPLVFQELRYRSSRISRPGSTFPSRGKRCFTTTFGDSSSCSDLTFCLIKQRFSSFGSRSSIYSSFFDKVFRSYLVTLFPGGSDPEFSSFCIHLHLRWISLSMAAALAVGSLYCLHLGFRTSSTFNLSLGGIAAGLCLASSISGKQYLVALTIPAVLYGAAYWRSLTKSVTGARLPLSSMGFWSLPYRSCCPSYLIENAYTLYESSFLRDFWHAVQTAPNRGIRRYIEKVKLLL